MDCAPGGVRRDTLLVCIPIFPSLAIHFDQSQALNRASSTWNSQHFLGPSCPKPL